MITYLRGHVAKLVSTMRINRVRNWVKSFNKINTTNNRSVWADFGCHDIALDGSVLRMELPSSSSRVEERVTVVSALSNADAPKDWNLLYFPRAP